MRHAGGPSLFRAFRRGAAVGLCVLLFLWSGNPAAAFAAPGADSLVTVTGHSVRDAASSTSPDPGAPAGFSLTVSPARLAIGQADIASAQHISVTNRGQSAAAVTVQKENFTTGPDGTVSFQDGAPYSASTWVTVDPMTFQVAPGTTQVVTATVAVPSDAEPGDHQIGLVFVVPGEPTNANIKIQRGIGMPVFITAPGPVDDAVSLSGVDAPGFAMSGPVTITASMHNTGTVHRDFRGTSPLVVQAPGSSAPFPDFTVPRDSTRIVSTTWDPPLLGIYQPTVQFTNADGSVQSASVRVIVFPVLAAAIILGALVLLWLLILFGRRAYRASVTKAAANLQRVAGTGDA